MWKKYIFDKLNMLIYNSIRLNKLLTTPVSFERGKKHQG